MEGLSINAYKGLSRYWKRQRYQRLSSSGGGRRRRWRIKISPKIKIKIRSPKKWLAGLRDAYVDMMLRFANSSGSGFVDNAAFGRAPVKEYDQKVILEIYKSVLMAQPQKMLAPDDLPSNSHPVNVSSTRSLAA